MNPVTYAGYELAIAALWFDDAVEGGVVGGPSPVNRQKCLDRIALAQEHGDLRVEEADDDLPTGQVVVDLLTSLVAEYLGVDDANLEERWAEIRDLSDKIIVHQQEKS